MEAQNTDGQAYPYQKLQWRGPHDVQVRILIIQPTTDPHQGISCKLDVAFIEDKPQFEALSYCWGDPTDTLSITIDGHSVNITRNLDSALRNLRREAAERALWVDAVCINQEDLKEKSYIVRNMHLFYQRAERTIVWLGEKSDDSDLAMDTVLFVGRAGILSEEEDLKLTKMFSPADNGVVPQETKNRWQLLSSLFGRAYWTRVWIVQEIVWSRHILVKCGERELAFDFFRLTAIRLNTVLLRDSAKLLGVEGYMRLRGMRPITLMVELHNRIWEAKSRPLGSVLSRMREAKASDPRDKIYGCITLADRLVEIDVRYDLSCAEIYTDAARAIIQNDQSVKILSSCEDFHHADDIPEHLTNIDGLERRDIPDLPSWAPNWAAARMGSELPGGYDEVTLEIELLTQLLDPPCPYRASGDAKASFQFLEDGVSLVTKGLVLDGIVDIGSDFWGKPISVDILKDAMSVCQRCPQTVARYQAGLINALILTLIGNRKASGAKYPASQAPPEENLHDRSVFESIRIMMAGRLFFVTSQGIMGLGSRGIRVNDRVCVIAGCHVPMVLRRMKKSAQPGCEDEEQENVTHEDTDYYHVVGPAYAYVRQKFGNAEINSFGDRLKTRRNNDKVSKMGTLPVEMSRNSSKEDNFKLFLDISTGGIPFLGVREIWESRFQGDDYRRGDFICMYMANGLGIA